MHGALYHIRLHVVPVSIQASIPSMNDDAECRVTARIYHLSPHAWSRFLCTPTKICMRDDIVCMSRKLAREHRIYTVITHVAFSVVKSKSSQRSSSMSQLSRWRLQIFASTCMADSERVRDH